MSTEKQYKKFQHLPEEWRNESMVRDEAGCRADIAKYAMNIVALRLAKELDQDLINLKEQVAAASAIYKEGDKENNLKIEFLIETLRSRGVNVPGIEDFLKAAIKGDDDVI